MMVDINKITSANNLGFLAAILTTFAFIPQLIRTWKTKSAKDVSLTTLILFISGLIFWIVYGFETHSPPVITANIITLLLNIFILILKVNNESKTPQEQ